MLLYLPQSYIKMYGCHMSTQISPVDEDAVAILASSPPPRFRSGGRATRDYRHCLATHTFRHNEDAPAPFRTAAKMRDQTTALVVLVRADQPALEQGREDLA